MSNLQKSLLASTPALLSALCLLSHSNAIAQTLAEPSKLNSNPQLSTDELLNQIQRYSPKQSKKSLSQVSNISQLRDVSPGDWAYEALRSLVERYGCIAGYPDGTYRGNRAMTRWEFAAGLNACLNQIERLLAENVAVLQEDVNNLKRLAQEFEAELATLGTRVDNLEGRVAFLEDHQFSTTTKLEGEVVVAVGGLVTGQGAEGEDFDTNPVLGYRARLELNTSFTGEDLLFTRLSTGNFPDLTDDGSNSVFEGDLQFAQPDDNDLGLEVLFYQFPVTDSTQIYIAGTGGAADDFLPTLNFLDGDGGTGALSAFGTRNPIYFSPDGAGVAVIQELGEIFELGVGYLAGAAEDPSEGSGLFNGPYSAIAQLTYKPSENFNLAFTYAHNYNQGDTGTGTQLSNFSFFTSEVLGIGEVPTSTNSYGLEFSWKVSDHFVIGGWGAYTNTITLSTLGGQLDRGDQDIWNWAVTFAFPDLITPGSTAGIIIGMEPWVSGSSIDIPDEDNTNDPGLHIEGLYQFQLNDNISITPGIIWITSPNGDSDNDDIVIGIIRTTFTF